MAWKGKIHGKDSGILNGNYLDWAAVEELEESYYTPYELRYTPMVITRFKFPNSNPVE